MYDQEENLIKNSEARELHQKQLSVGIVKTTKQLRRRCHHTTRAIHDTLLLQVFFNKQEQVLNNEIVNWKSFKLSKNWCA